MVEDCEEAFVKNPDGHPLVLYLKTGPDHSLTGPTRQLLKRVNLADKASKIKVCCVIFHLLLMLRMRLLYTLHVSQISAQNHHTV